MQRSARCSARIFEALWLTGMNSFALLLLLVQLVSGPSSVKPLEGIRARTPVEQVTNPTPVEIAGSMPDPSMELVKRLGGVLSGGDLQVFPDQT